MENALKNLFAVTDLRNRILFTLALLGVYRIGSHIPTPGVNTQALAILAEQARNTMFGLYDMFSGQNLSQMTIFALGVRSEEHTSELQSSSISYAVFCLDRKSVV